MYLNNKECSGPAARRTWATDGALALVIASYYPQWTRAEDIGARLNEFEQKIQGAGVKNLHNKMASANDDDGLLDPFGPLIVSNNHTVIPLVHK